MADKSLDIVLRILTKEVGPQKAAEVVKKLRTETEKSNVVNREAGNVLAKTRSELESNVKVTGSATVENIKLREAARGLNVQFPMLGRAMLLFTNPLAALSGILVSTIALFFKLRNEAKALAAEVDFTPMAKSNEALAQSARLAADDLNKFWDSLQKGSSVNESLSRSADETIRKIQDEAAAAETLASAQNELALAKLKAAHAGGEMSDEEFAARQSGLQVAGDLARFNRDKSTRSAIMTAMQTDLERRQAARGAGLSAVAAAEKEKIGAESVFDRTNARFQDAQGELAALNEKEKTVGRLRPDEFRRKLLLQRIVAAEQFKVADAQSAIGTADSRLKSAQNEVTTNDTAIAGLKNRIGGASASNALLDSSQGAALNLRAEARSPGAGMLLSAATGADAIRGGGRASPDESRAMNEAVRLLNLRGASEDQILKILGQLNDKEEYLLNALQRLESRTATMANVP
jgi:hypothetical protein